MAASGSECVLGLPRQRLGSGLQFVTSEDSFWVTIVLVLPAVSGVFRVIVLVLSAGLV